MIRLYQRACRGCRTVNQISRVHIALENRLTPAEAATLHDELMARRGWGSTLGFWPTRAVALATSRFPRLLRSIGRSAERARHERRWIRRLHGMQFRGAEDASPESFRRSRLGEHMVLYSDRGERSSKTLVVAFTGSSARLMLPTPVFLQQLSAQNVDLLFVRYPPGRGFFHGLLPGDTFYASLDRIAILAMPNEYRRAVAFGTSGGALTALMAARRLGFAGAVVVGSKGPDDRRWQVALGLSAGEVLGATAESPAMTGVSIIVGADHPRDREAARQLSTVIPAARLVVVGDPAGLVGHNPLVPLLRRGDLAALFRRLMLDG